MTTPIHAQLAAIHVYTAGVEKARTEYRTHPFAATHVRLCAGTCGGYICSVDHTEWCDPCREAARQR